jgi:N-acetylated-alpha-linked acidic dipeptidase
MRRAALVTLILASPAVAQESFLGYRPTRRAEQQALEQRFHRLVNADSISAIHRPLSARPHPAGSEGARAVIRHLEQSLARFGLRVERHDYQAWLSAPREVAVTLTAPAARELSLREATIGEDPTSSHPELGDGYIAYSASGDVTGEVVYVNYGLPADYEALKRLGVEARGRIVLARYGRSHRAVKVHTAQEAGARAIVLYSDPADDGFARGAVWPPGYWRGEQMLQRGNAKLSWFFHGDPLTPGIAATRDAARLDPARAPTLPKIPVVAISWGEARHVLSSLGGAEAPAPFVGRVPGVTYRTGPGPAALHVRVRMDDGLRRISNVVATLAGRTQPDRVILLGGHHDAWTFGAVDPGTGSAALLELARVLGRMARTGWRPERTIQIAFWDAEEFGLVGSTEHAEHFRDQLKERLIAYVNIDMYMKGRFDPGGVPSLRDFVADVARSVATDSGSVYDGWAAETERRQAGSAPDLKALGSGADFVPFQDFLGVPTLSIEFIGANGYGFGTYHTNYDSRAYVERVADPGFRQGVTMVRTLGALALRLANADVLPFRFSHYAGKLETAVSAVDDAARAAGPRAQAVPVPELRALVARVGAAAGRLERAIETHLQRRAIPQAQHRELNDRLARLEQLLADDVGAPDRAWFRHVFHGWNIYSLYDGQLFPGMHEALRDDDSGRITAEAMRVRGALDRMANGLEQMITLVEGPR